MHDESGDSEVEVSMYLPLQHPVEYYIPGPASCMRNTDTLPSSQRNLEKGYGSEPGGRLIMHTLRSGMCSVMKIVSEIG